MMFRIGKSLFREHYVCFHIDRDNIYSPWRVIGVYAGYHDDARCRYIYEYRHLEAEFYKEVDRAGDLSGSYDFMVGWQSQHVELNSLITPVIKYRTTESKVWRLIENFTKTYLGASDAWTFFQIAFMLKFRHKYYPLQFINREMKRFVSFVDDLLEAKEIL